MYSVPFTPHLNSGGGGDGDGGDESLPVGAEGGKGKRRYAKG